MEGRIGLWYYIELFKIFFPWNKICKKLPNSTLTKALRCCPQFSMVTGNCRTVSQPGGCAIHRQHSDFTTFKWSRVCDLCSVTWVDFCNCHNEDTELFHHRDLVLSLTSHTFPATTPNPDNCWYFPVVLYNSVISKTSYRMWCFEIGFFQSAELIWDPSTFSQQFLFIVDYSSLCGAPAYLNYPPWGIWVVPKLWLLST